MTFLARLTGVYERCIREIAAYAWPRRRGLLVSQGALWGAIAINAVTESVAPAFIETILGIVAVAGIIGFIVVLCRKPKVAGT